VRAAFLDGDAVGFAIAGLFDRATCDALRARLDGVGFAATGRAYPGGYRDNDRVVVDDAAMAAAWFDRARRWLPETLDRDGARWRLVGLNPRFRGCRYRGGQAFCVHRDGPYVPADDERSWLTMQLYLDDGAGFRGGRTRFYAGADGGAPVAAVMPVAGTAIVFDHGAWHDGEAVVEGTKHVLRTDVMYRREGPAARAGHRGYAWRVIARAGGTLASSGRDGTVREWLDGAQLAVHHVAAGSVTALCERAGVLWFGTRAGVVAPIGGVDVDVGGAVLDLAPSRYGVVAALSTGEVVAVDTSVRARRRVHAGWAWGVATLGDRVWSCGDDERAIAVRADGALLVGDAGGGVTWIGRPRRVLHAGAVTSVAFGPGERWASGGEDGVVVVLDGDRELARHVSADFVRSVTFTADGAVAWCGYDGVVCRRR
jgi:hypothetical protein